MGEGIWNILQYFATPPPPPPPGCNKWRLPILDFPLVTWLALSLSYENTILLEMETLSAGMVIFSTFLLNEN